ncbi:cell 5A endo-1,4-betaglucanase [Achlya hypogyna]|uniref:Cell 5A endo-1,4-betaglucanase n=1 Tax=Achlya hypogyna TaxID=1202772 RepID=A0A1V9Z1W5_ACHHY|nr:cell 5A endo-1,4-betaglucanase [Achlya hypogyna]
MTEVFRAPSGRGQPLERIASTGSELEVVRQSTRDVDSQQRYSFHQPSAYDSQRSARQMEMVIPVLPLTQPESSSSYKGRFRVWPGILLLTFIVGASVALIATQAKVARDNAEQRAAAYQLTALGRRSIDGKNGGVNVADDGQLNNPVTYSTQSCAQVDYQSKNGKIFVVAPNGTEIPISIKGTNWFGMETGNAVPFGLWTNDRNGTTAYEVADFLSRNKYNAVRVPVCITSILKNTPPREGLVNVALNRAMDLTNYITTLQSVIKALAYRNIGVLISLHTLTTTVSGGNWYDAKLGISQDDFLDAVDILTKNLCSAKYWNIMGLDLKNEPHETTWDDWVKGSAIIAARMHAGCPNWMGFVEGINAAHKMTIDGTEWSYFDWWGGGLQGAKTNPAVFQKPNKLVYAPHYYNTAVSPQPYLYGPKNAELDDETLRRRVQASSEDMFGFLVTAKTDSVVLGEFAGLYKGDQSPKLTIRRTTDFLIEVMVAEGYAGGFMWSLNPESAYQYNPAPGTYHEGLLEDDWLTSNTVFLKGMAAMDKLPDLKPWPCIPPKKP